MDQINEVFQKVKSGEMTQEDFAKWVEDWEYAAFVRGQDSVCDSRWED